MDNAGASLARSVSPIVEQIARINDIRNGLADTLSLLRNIADTLGLPEHPDRTSPAHPPATTDVVGTIPQLAEAVNAIGSMASSLYSAAQRLNQVG